jgi:hypothetical protein
VRAELDGDELEDAVVAAGHAPVLAVLLVCASRGRRPEPSIVPMVFFSRLRWFDARRVAGPLPRLCRVDADLRMARVSGA